MNEELPPFGFSRWDIEPRRDQSTLGFFCEMLEREGEDNFSRFSYLNEMKDKSIVHADVVAFLEQYPFSDEVKERFRRSAPVLLPGKSRHKSQPASIRGEIVEYQDIMTNRRRWCQACLAEEPYRRLWFDLRFIQRCPYHGIPMEDRLKSGRPVPFERVNYDDVIEQGLLSRPRQLRVGSFGHYVLGRLDCEEGFSVPLLDGQPLLDVVDTVESVGKFLSRPWSARQPGPCEIDEAEAGFDALKQGDVHLVRSVIAWAKKNVPANRAGRSVQLGFTWMYNYTLTNCGDFLGSKLGRTLHVANTVLRGSPREITESYLNSPTLTLDDGARRLGMMPATLGIVLRELNLVEQKRGRGSITEEDVALAERFVRNLIGPDEFYQILGFKFHHEFGKRGFIKCYPGSAFGRRGPWFKPEDVTAILERMRALPITGRIDIGHTFKSAAQQFGITMYQLAMSILDGKHNIAGVGDLNIGFRGLIIETGKANKSSRQIGKPYLPPGKVKAREVAKIIGISKRDISDLVEAGYLTPLEMDGGHRLFDKAIVDRFVADHLKPKQICGLLDMRLHGFMATMAAAGVEPVVAYDPTYSQYTFYRKAEVAAALGIDHSKLELNDPVLQMRYTELVTQIRRAIPSLRVPEDFLPGGCWGATSYKERTVRFDFDPVERTLSAAVSPLKKGGTRVVFPLCKSLDYGQVSTLLEALLAKQARLREKQRLAGVARRQLLRDELRASGNGSRLRRRD